MISLPSQILNVSGYTMNVTVSEYKILSTGIDGGHRYLESELIHKGLLRRLIIYFQSKSDEQKIEANQILYIEGDLKDDGLIHSLILLNARILYQQTMMDKDIINVFKERDGIETSVELRNGKIYQVWNIAWGYDLGDSYAHITTNISPAIESAPIDFFYSSEIVRIIDRAKNQTLLEMTN